jgi:sugar-specific transcriptional regulator TrmB
MDKKLLQEIGLTNSEITVYTELLKTGSTKVGILMKRLSLHRSRVYEAINRLTDKGLVSYVIRNNVKYFEASDPERLLSYIEEQKAKLNEKEKSIKKILPELKKQISPLMPHAEAHVFVGKDGFKTIRKDVLKQKQDLYLIGALGKEHKFLKYFFPNFDKLRVKNKIKQKTLFDYEIKGKKVTKLPLMETRFLPKEYSSPAVINIYADRVVNVLWQGDTPLCFMIINQQIADSYRKWFNLLWKNSKNF